MRFRLCGGLDAPDWFLAEIALLADLSAAEAGAVTEEVCA